jgi:hypothetical protein
VRQARAGLVRAGRIAFTTPLDQLLSLDAAAPTPVVGKSSPPLPCERARGAPLAACDPPAGAGDTAMIDY